MNFSSIKTKNEFYEACDIQYQRSHRLRYIWQNENESQEKREKAYKLWRIILNRVIGLFQITIQLNQPRKPIV